MLAALDTEQTLLALKIGFLVLLYLFIWAVVRSVTRDLRSAPQESIILSAQESNELRSRYEPVVQAPVARMLVLDSPALQPGTTVELKTPTRLGRGGENAIRLDGDDFASTRHALLEPRPDGLWVEDVGSTNGTFVNGAASRRRASCRRATSSASARRTSGWKHEDSGMNGRASALTDTGRRRPQNEDTFVCDPPLFAVADGVGGAQAGEIASRLAAAALEERAPDALGEETLAALLREANDRIYRHALEDPTAAGMGTVVTALLVDEAAGEVAIGHVGDSRAYLLRDDVLEQLTADHSLVGELVRSGQLSTEEAEQHPHRSVITRAVGTEPSVDVETLSVEAAPGDLYLICSDGLTDIVRDPEIAELILAAGKDPDAAAEALVDAANRNGGIDNITVVLFEIVAGEPTPLEAFEPEPQAAVTADPDEDTMEQALRDAERRAEPDAARRPRR